jgi:hypothetical protein
MKKGPTGGRVGKTEKQGQRTQGKGMRDKRI